MEGISSAAKPIEISGFSRRDPIALLSSLLRLITGSSLLYQSDVSSSITGHLE